MIKPRRDKPESFHEVVRKTINKHRKSYRKKPTKEMIAGITDLYQRAWAIRCEMESVEKRFCELINALNEARIRS